MAIGSLPFYLTSATRCQNYDRLIEVCVCVHALVAKGPPFLTTESLICLVPIEVDGIGGQPPIVSILDNKKMI